MKFGLKNKTIKAINSVFAKYPAVDKVILYGSRAKGTYQKSSDIDLTLIGEDLTDQDRTNIYFDLDDLLTPYMFDLSMLSQIDNENLKEHIKRVGKIFYQKT